MGFPPWTIRSSITTHEKVCRRSQQPEAHDFSRVYFTVRLVVVLIAGLCCLGSWVWMFVRGGVLLVGVFMIVMLRLLVGCWFLVALGCCILIVRLRWMMSCLGGWFIFN